MLNTPCNGDYYAQSVVRNPVQLTTNVGIIPIIEVVVTVALERKIESLHPNLVGYWTAIKRNHIVKSVVSKQNIKSSYLSITLMVILIITINLT
jgi:hypothetical protein